MTLFSLLLALALDRMMALPRACQLDRLVSYYLNLFSRIGGHGSVLMFMLVVLLPVGACYWLFNAVQGMWFGVVTILLLTVTILICISNLHYRRLYKHYVKAACRGDEQACYHIAEQLGAKIMDTEMPTLAHERIEHGVGQQLSWVSYQYYIGVMLWLIVAGPAGMLCYALIRELSYQDSPYAHRANKVNQWMDWIPVRVASFGLAMVGNFSHAIPVWLEQQLKLEISPRQHLISVAMQAEHIKNPGNPVCIDSTCKFVEIGKRNVMLTITLISIMTIYGSLI